MNSFVLLIPFLLIRFGFMSRWGRRALKRAGHFAPRQGREVAAYSIYQLANIGIFTVPLFSRLDLRFSWLTCLGGLCYLGGLSLCAVAVASFSVPDATGLNTGGIYRFSRHPMYVAYFLCFFGIAMLARSWVLLGLVLIFQFSAHWIILSEERWCIQRFGRPYQEYMERVRRYF